MRVLQSTYKAPNGTQFPIAGQRALIIPEELQLSLINMYALQAPSCRTDRSHLPWTERISPNSLRGRLSSSNRFYVKRWEILG